MFMQTNIAILCSGIIEEEAKNALAEFVNSLGEEYHIAGFQIDTANISIDDEPRDVTGLYVTFDGFENPFFRRQLMGFTGLDIVRFPNQQYVYGFVDRGD